MRREQQLHPPCVPPPKQAEVPSAVHRESAQGGGPGAVQVMVLFKLRVKALTRVISSHRHLEFLVSQLAAWLDDVVFRMQSGPSVYLLNGRNGLRRIGNSSGLRCPADASLGSITLRNDSARTLAMVKWYPLRHPMVKPYPRIYLYLPYIFKFVPQKIS